MKKLFIILIFIPSCFLFAQKQSYQESVDLAKKKFDGKMYEEAIKLIDVAISKKPKVAENYYFKGMCFFRQHKHKEAIEQFDKAIARNGKKWLYFKFRGDAYYNTEAYEQALQDLGVHCRTGSLER